MHFAPRDLPVRLAQHRKIRKRLIRHLGHARCHKYASEENYCKALASNHGLTGLEVVENGDRKD